GSARRHRPATGTTRSATTWAGRSSPDTTARKNWKPPEREEALTCRKGEPRRHLLWALPAAWCAATGLPLVAWCCDVVRAPESVGGNTEGNLPTARSAGPRAPTTARRVPPGQA